VAATTSHLKYAVRVALKNPRFTLVTMGALALGIGANAAIFSVINAVLLRPLPYPEPDRLVQGCRQYPSGFSCNASIPKYMTWRQAKSFESVAAYDFSGPGLNLVGRDRPEQIRGIHASADYFRVFGTKTSLGRTFSADEDRPGGPRVAVLSHHTWAARFGSDPAILGRAISLNGDPYTVVGVLDPSFRNDPPADVFIPLQADPNSTNQGHYLMVTARLKPGVALASARAEMKLLGGEFRRKNPRWMSKEEQATVRPLQDIVVEDVRPALLVLAGAVGLVLLIACANAANLLLARASARQKEVAVRAALGASRTEIVRQLLTESVLLSAAAAVLGVLAGVWGARALIAVSPGGLPRANELANASVLVSLLDWRVLAFTVGIALLTAVLFGLAPALHLARTDLGATLKDAGGRGTAGSRAAWTRGLLVVAEVALALVLLVGATLLVRTFAELRQVRPGFETHNVLTMQTSLAGEKYAVSRNVASLIRQVTERVDALPGVVASATAITIPTEGGVDLPFRIEGRALSGDSPFHGDEQWRCVSWEYFRVFDIPLVRGRVFTDRDSGSGSPVAVINAALAKKYWKDADPIGQQLTIGKGLGPEFDDPTRTIVGVVGDVRENGLNSEPPPIVYIPTPQLSDAFVRLGNSVIPMTWVVRATSDPALMTASIQREFLAVDGQLPVAKVRTMEQVLSESLEQQNFNMLLLTVFGTIALGLAALGIYGLMSYTVEQGTHDIGLRLALGADRRDILSMVMRRGIRLALIGLAAGLVAALAMTRVLGRFLFGVHATDPATYVGVTAVLGGIALLACYVPARRAMSVDPIVALRQE
jgi:putative ABC transport system permease protein